ARVRLADDAEITHCISEADVIWHPLRRLAAMTIFGGLGLALVACGSDGEPASRTEGWHSNNVRATQDGVPFTPQVLNSPNGLGVGTNRLALALFRDDGTLVADALVTAHVV